MVEPAPDADRDGIPDTVTGTTPLAAARRRESDGDRTVRDVGSPIPDRGR